MKTHLSTRLFFSSQLSVSWNGENIIVLSVFTVVR